MFTKLDPRNVGFIKEAGPIDAVKRVAGAGAAAIKNVGRAGEAVEGGRLGMARSAFKNEYARQAANDVEKAHNAWGDKVFSRPAPVGLIHPEHDAWAERMLAKLKEEPQGIPDLSAHAVLHHEPAKPPPVPVKAAPAPVAAPAPEQAPVAPVAPPTAAPTQAPAPTPEPTKAPGTTAALQHLKGVPSWMLTAPVSAGVGAMVDDEDRTRGAMHGAILGGLGGLAWDAMPVIGNAAKFGSEKQGYFTPSVSTTGGISISGQGGERMAGTSHFAGRDVIERAGEALDHGASFEEAKAIAQNSPKTRYLPIVGSIAGGLLGRTVHNSPAGWLTGSALGGVAGALGKPWMQHQVDNEAHDAVRGLLIERAAMGDQNAQRELAMHHARMTQQEPKP